MYLVVVLPAVPGDGSDAVGLGIRAVSGCSTSGNPGRLATWITDCAEGLGIMLDDLAAALYAALLLRLWGAGY